jgi:hypothetical protein
MCLLRFENNLFSSEGVHFALISKKTPFSKLSFAFVSLALPLLTMLVQSSMEATESLPGIVLYFGNHKSGVG